MKQLLVGTMLAVMVSVFLGCGAVGVGAGLMGGAMGAGIIAGEENKKPEKTVIRNEKGEITSIIYNLAPSAFSKGTSHAHFESQTSPLRPRGFYAD